MTALGIMRSLEEELGSAKCVVAMKTYAAVCQRSGDWWAVRVPELKGLFTQARRIDQIEPMVRDAISVMLEVDPGTFAVEVMPELPSEVGSALEARRLAAEAEARATEATRVAVETLLSSSFTVREAGVVLGISPQRVSQIAGGGSSIAKKSRAGKGRAVRRAAAKA